MPTIIENSHAGFSLVEVLLAVALFALIATGFAGAYFYGQEATVGAGLRTQATVIAQEGLAAVRNIRDADFQNLDDGTYGLDVAGGEYELVGDSDTTGPFTREITISSAGSNRKSVTAAVSWSDTAGRDGRIQLQSRLTYWREIKQSQPDCTGPPNERPPECDGGGGPPGNGGGNQGGGPGNSGNQGGGPPN